VLPIAIRVNNMRGLRKGDPFYRTNGEDRYEFAFSLCDVLHPEQYAEHPVPAATRMMTEDIKNRIVKDVSAL
jgi:hypothetical protein